MPKAAKPISELFRVPSRFVRSVQLERDFHDSTALDEYIVTPAMADAFQRIRAGLLPDSGRRAWRITGDYGVGKSSFALVAAHLLAGSGGPSAERVAADLGWDTGADLAPRLWPVLLTGSRSSIVSALGQAIAAAIVDRRPARGRVPRKHTELIDRGHAVAQSSDLADLESLLADFCALAAESGAGVILVLDELGKFLEHTALGNGADDVFVLQRLAEMASRSGRHPFLLLGLLHQGFHAYAERLPMAARNEWEKVAGRFEEIVFDQPLAHMAALVAGALSLDAATFPPRVRSASAEVAAATAKAGWLGGGTVGAAGLDVARLYPIHTTVLPVLMRFFARFGQHERSLFGFLLSNEPFGLQDFARRPVSPTAWYRLDDLYDYVRACFGHRLAGASYRSHWLRIASTIDAVADASEFELRLLKAIAVLNLLDADDLVPTRRALQACFAPNLDDDVASALDRLEKRGLLFSRGSGGGYRLWPSASVNLEEALRQAERALGPIRSVAAELVPQLTPTPLMARRHYLEEGTLRHFELRYCEASDLHSCAARDTDGDGLFVIALPDDDAGHAAATAAAEGPGVGDRSDVVVLIARPVSTLAAELGDLRLWDWVSRNVVELGEDDYAMAEVARQTNLARHALLARLDFLIGLNGTAASGNWLWQGEPLPAEALRASTSRLLSQICERLFPLAPKIANELLNRNALSSAAAAARMRLIERIFDSAELPDLGLPEAKAPPEKSIYLSVLKAGKVHVEGEGGYIVALPGADDPLRLRPALDAVIDTIVAGRGNRIAVTAIIARLRESPFGVRDGVTPLLLALVLRTQAHELAVYEHGTFLHRFGASDFQRLIKGPQNFEIQHCQIAGVRLEVFDALLQSFASGPSGRRLDLLDVVRPLCQFAAQLPEYTRKASVLSPIALSVRSALLDAREPLRLLFDELPRACECQPFEPGAPLRARDAKLFVGRLQEAIEELRQAYELLLQRIRDRIGHGLGQPSFDRVGIASRAARVSLVASEPRLRTFALRLRDPGLSDNAWAEALGSYIAAKPPAKWLAADVARFEAEAGMLAEHFAKTEAAAFSRSDLPPQRDAIRLNLTRGDGDDLVKVIESVPDEDLAQAADLLSGRMPQDVAYRLRLLTELLWRELSVASKDDTTGAEVQRPSQSASS